jgi:hypothetical protein
MRRYHAVIREAATINYCAIVDAMPTFSKTISDDALCIFRRACLPIG